MAEYWEKPKQQQQRSVNTVHQSEKSERTEGLEQGKQKFTLSLLRKN